MGLFNAVAGEAEAESCADCARSQNDLRSHNAGSCTQT